MRDGTEKEVGKTWTSGDPRSSRIPAASAYSRTMIGVGAPSSIVTAHWPAVVVIQRIDPGSP
jgi:hypothetical protein